VADEWAWSALAVRGAYGLKDKEAEVHSMPHMILGVGLERLSAHAPLASPVI
jgi:hypothetical protein